MDVMYSYLNVPLDNEIYVDPPKCFEDKNGNYVCEAGAISPRNRDNDSNSINKHRYAVK